MSIAATVATMRWEALSNEVLAEDAISNTFCMPSLLQLPLYNRWKLEDVSRLSNSWMVTESPSSTSGVLEFKSASRRSAGL